MIIQTIKKSIIGWVVFSLTILVFSIWYATIANIWTNTSELEVTTESTLSADNWNKLLGNFENLKTDINTIYNSTTGRVKVWFIQCVKYGPTLWRVYDCNWSDIWASWVSDVVAIRCPTGFLPIWWGWYNSSSIRQSVPETSPYNWWVLAGSTNFWEIKVNCMKVE